jgi:hypothetical protein
VSAARIKQIDKQKNALLKKVDPLMAKKKKLYSNMDITSAKSAEEKQLDKEIADLFSEIQTLIREKRKLTNFTAMPIKKKTTAAKKPAAKKPAVLGPKAKLMKLLVGTLRTKAKKLGISDVSKRTKENLAQSIMLAEARKKRGTAMGKKATAKKAASTRGADRQTKGTPNESIKADNQREALAPGRRTSKSGNVYSERRRDRSDKPGTMNEPYTMTEFVFDQLDKLNWDGQYRVNVRFTSDIADAKPFGLSRETIPAVIQYLESILAQNPESIQ